MITFYKIDITKIVKENFEIVCLNQSVNNIIYCKILL